MSANAIDGKGDAQKPFSFHFNQNNVFHGEEKISEWRKYFLKELGLKSSQS